MMKLFCGLILLTTTYVWAGIHEASISSIDYGRTPDEKNLLYLSDGHVIKLPSTDWKELSAFEELKDQNKIIRFKTNSSREMKSFKVIGTMTFTENPSLHTEYTPTILNSPEEASRIFRNLRKDYSSYSQCYNRAFVWAYESKNESNLNSMKVFMFYTRKYIRQYNFEWWFHVAPFTYIKENGNVEERVLDPRFTKAPKAMKSWTDIFMKNKAVCPVINQYSEYENNQETEHCYLYKTSMYYVQPLDLDNLERTGKTKTQFFNYEVKRAYRNGFGQWWY